MDQSKLFIFLNNLLVFTGLFLIVFIYTHYENTKNIEHKNIWYTPIRDSLIVSGDIVITIFLLLHFPSGWLLWIILNIFLWSFLISKSTIKEKTIDSTDVHLDQEDIKLREELDHFRMVKKHKERRENFIKNELNELIGYIVHNKERVKNNNRYKNSVVDIFNEMYQEGFKKGKSNSQILEEINDFFENHLLKTLTHGMSERFRTLIEKLKDISFIDEDETEVKVEKVRRPSIPQSVKDRVWNRDGGKCVQCGSNEKIEFDHIIPFSKGGTDTYRNLQILCEKCNRSKSDKIG